MERGWNVIYPTANVCNNVHIISLAKIFLSIGGNPLGTGGKFTY